MTTYTDRIVAQEEKGESSGRPMVLASVRLEVAPEIRKGCPMQCVGECGGGPCGNDCFCVSFDPSR